LIRRRIAERLVSNVAQIANVAKALSIDVPAKLLALADEAME
jgi:hypothetical protein